MRLPRSSGLLLHPTSLPGRFGIGDLGPSAYEFIDLLVETGQRWWQTLPLGPTGFGNSPYQSYSSYAGNPLLISPEGLVNEGWITPNDWAGYPAFSDDKVEFDSVVLAKEKLLRQAYANAKPLPAEFSAFVAHNHRWLADYALYMALKERHDGGAWYDWEPDFVARDHDALEMARDELTESIRYYEFVQWVFDRQWSKLRSFCQTKQISLMGDLPIFVAQDSADVWARPDLFWLDARGLPTVVAGVPPDYFAATGQLWGNPLYRWEAHAADGFAWWLARLRGQISRVDLVRLDHFRGFQAYWEVPAHDATAINGRWALGPGTAFLEAVREGLGGLPLVAEDLGDITPEVENLRDRFELPGMRVIQFGLSGEKGTDFHLPFRFVNHCIAYTGTHDNDTTLGWFSQVGGGSAHDRNVVKAHRRHGLEVLGSNSDEVHWDVIRAAMASVADTVIIPLQDVLGLGTSARMNVPGRPDGNWSWRFRHGQVRSKARERLAKMTAVYGRWNGDPFGRGSH